MTADAAAAAALLSYQPDPSAHPGEAPAPDDSFVQWGQFVNHLRKASTCYVQDGNHHSSGEVSEHDALAGKAKGYVPIGKRLAIDDDSGPRKRKGQA